MPAPSTRRRLSTSGHASAGPTGNDRRSKPLLLVVESHPDTRLGLEMCLRWLDCHLQFAGTVREALSLAEGKSPDVLLTETNLPDGSGLGLLATLEAAGWRPARAVSMSSVYDGAELSRSKAAGFDKHLLKPLVAEELAELLRSAV